MTRHLEHRTNNAYDSILLVEDGKVVGEWTTTRDDKVWRDYVTPGNLANWDTTLPDCTDPEGYGDLVPRD